MKSIFSKFKFFLRKGIKYRLKTISLFKNRPDSCFILIGSPRHGNLGDHAISVAEMKFFRDNFPNEHVIEIAGEHFRTDPKGIKKYISLKDTLYITGGGFMGSLWMTEEKMVREIISLFPENLIIIFPQTIYFEKSESGEKEKRESFEVYKKHKKIIFTLRDENSLSLMQNEHGGSDNLVYLPDIVTYLDLTEPRLDRKHITFCLRQDKEKVIEPEYIESIEKRFNPEDIKHISTVIPKKVSFYEREQELTLLLEQFKQSRIVITDRLHGMLFAAITATPCIALDNLSGKVRGVYKWIEHLPYIKFADSYDKLPELIDLLLRNEQLYVYDKKNPEEHFSALVSLIAKNSGGRY